MEDNNIVLISDINDFSKLKFNKPFRFYCKKCGQLSIVNSFRKHRIPHYSNFLCKKCGQLSNMDYNSARKKAEITNIKRYGISVPSKLECVKLKMKQTNLIKYGYSAPSKNPEIANLISKSLSNKSVEEWEEITRRRSETKLERYGDGKYNNRDKVRSTNIKRYGENYVKIFIDKAKLTCEKKYGDPNYSNNDKKIETFKKNHNGMTIQEYNNTDICKYKIKNTKLKRYGNKNYNNINKMRTTKLNKYNNEHYTNRKQAEMTCKKLYNNIYPMKNEDIKNRAISAKLVKYGNLRGPNGDVCYYGINMNSSWELAVWIYCIDNNIPIIREPCTFNYIDMYDKIHYYIPDFMINGQLVEIKGDHYFDNEGNMIYPYNKKKVNGVWVPLTKEEKEYMDDLYNRKYKCIIANNVLLWKKEDILPYINYCNNKYPNWNILFRKDNIFNPSYYNYTIPLYYNNGITPFDINKNDNDKYVDIGGKGLTPFDL